MHAHACSHVRQLRGAIAGAAQPETVFGSPETLVAKGVDDALDVTKRWAHQIAVAVDNKLNAAAIGAALRGVRARMNTADLADLLEQTNLHGQMLGALDSQWESQEERAVAPAEFRALDTRPRDTSPRFAGAPYSQALNYFESKSVVDADTFRQMSAEARKQAFTVAGMASDSMLRTAQAELARQVRAGADLRDFRKFVENRLTSAGWVPANASHVETIFRTNTVGAYNMGRYREQTQPDVMAFRPYWQIVTVNDGPPRQRPTHRAVHLWVLRADDPFWVYGYPPFGYNCRCRVRTLSQRQVERMRLTIRTGTQIRGLPDPGFRGGAPPPVVRRTPVPQPGAAAPPPTVPKGEAIGRPKLLPKLQFDKDGRPKPITHKLGELGPIYNADQRQALGRHLSSIRALETAPSPAVQREARHRLRELLAEDGFDTRVQSARDAADRVKPAALAGARAEYNLVTGQMRVMPEVLTDAQRAVRALEQGRQPFTRELHGLRTLLHEEMHGASRIQPLAYQGSSAALEEALTEMAARRHVVRISGRSYDPPAADFGSLGYGSYWQERQQLHRFVRNALHQSGKLEGLAQAELERTVDDAIHQATRVMRGPKGQTIHGPSEHLDVFSRSVPGLTDEARRKLRSDLDYMG